MAKICLKPEQIAKIEKSEELLKTMNTTKQRRDFFVKEFGEDFGTKLNAKYELSLLYRKTDSAFKKFVSNVDKKKQDELSDIIKQRFIEKQNKIDEGIIKIGEEGIEGFRKEELFELANEAINKKYKLDVSLDDTIKLNTLGKEEKQLGEIFEQLKNTDDIDAKTLDEAQMAYGLKMVEKERFVKNLIDPASDMSFLGKDGKKGFLTTKLNEAWDRVINADPNAKGITFNRTAALGKEVLNAVIDAPLKGIKAAWDASMLLRQGLPILLSSRNVYKKNLPGVGNIWLSVITKQDAKKAMQEMMDVFRARQLTDVDYDEAIKSGLKITGKEDFFPDNVAERIPFGLGRFFQASDASFTQFMQGTRLDLYKKYKADILQVRKEKGLSQVLDEKELKAVADWANVVTGTSNLGQLESFAGNMNKILFSARFQWANIKYLTKPFLGTDIPPEIRGQMVKDTLRFMSIIGGLGVAVNMAGGQVELDPRSKNFGKMRVGDKQVDLTAGKAQYISTVTRAIAKAFGGEPKYGKDDGVDILIDFSLGKLAPVPGAVRDLLRQRKYGGGEPTPVSVLRSLLVPISVDNVATNIQEQKEANEIFIQLVAETLGIGVSNYSKDRK